MKNLRVYWDYLVQNKDLYQMGPLSHRIYLLDLLKERGVKEILDVGCGTGPIYELIKNTKTDHWIEMALEYEKRWKFKYKGTDYSEGMIESCKEHFPEGNWQVQDARQLLEFDNSWECVLLMHSLDHVDDYQKTIQEAARVSSKYVLIVLWRGLNYAKGAVNNLNNRSRYGKEDNEPDWEDTHLQDFAWEPLKKAFDDAKLTIALIEDGEIVNKEKKYNTVILLEKI